MLINEKVILLKKVHYSESDLILSGLNNQGSILRFIAKSALKSQKRFGGGVLEPTHYVQVVYKYKGNTDKEQLCWLNEASLLNGFTDLRKDYDRLETAFYILQVVLKVAQEGLVDGKDIFLLLGNVLKSLETTEQIDLLRTQFEVKLLYQQGVLAPDASTTDFLSTKIREHQQIQVTSSQLNQVKSQIQRTFNNYLSMS